MKDRVLLVPVTTCCKELCVRLSLYCFTTSENLSPKTVGDSIGCTRKDCLVSVAKSETAK